MNTSLTDLQLHGTNNSHQVAVRISGGAAVVLYRRSGSDSLESISGCTKAIIDDYKRVYGRAPECIDLVLTPGRGRSLAERWHDLYGLPRMAQTPGLHGFSKGESRWVYGSEAAVAALTAAQS